MQLLVLMTSEFSLLIDKKHEHSRLGIFNPSYVHIPISSGKTEVIRAYKVKQTHI